MKRSLLLLTLLFVSLILGGCIMSSTPSSPVSVSAGDSITFKVTVFPVNITVQWYVDTNLVSGTTEKSFIYSPEEGDVGTHTITIKETSGCIFLGQHSWEVEVISSIKDITQFTILGINGTIGTNTIALTVPYGTSLTSLTPTITHTGASINPASGVAQNFTNPVQYTVTAEDGSMKNYMVTVSVAPNKSYTFTATWTNRPYSTATEEGTRGNEGDGDDSTYWGSYVYTNIDGDFHNENTAHLTYTYSTPQIVTSVRFKMIQYAYSTGNNYEWNTLSSSLCLYDWSDNLVATLYSFSKTTPRANYTNDTGDLTYNTGWANIKRVELNMFGVAHGDDGGGSRHRLYELTVNTAD